MTITEFLTARLDEDEHQARLTIENRTSSPARALLGPTDIFGHMEVQPEHVLADIAAKRAIVALHSEGTMACYWSHDSMEMHGPGEVCDTLQALVQPYAEHPDFDPAWRV